MSAVEISREFFRPVTLEDSILQKLKDFKVNYPEGMIGTDRPEVNAPSLNDVDNALVTTADTMNGTMDILRSIRSTLWGSVPEPASEEQPSLPDGKFDVILYHAEQNAKDAGVLNKMAQELLHRLLG